MEANLGFNGYRCYQTIMTKTVTLTESQDCVVPDTLPDIASVLCTSGSVLIRSKDVAEGHVRMEANVPARVCCAGEGSGERFCLDVNIPFYISAEDEAISDGSVCKAELRLTHLETRMLNPRKISVRAEICAILRCYAQTNMTFSTAPIDDSGAIHVMEREAELSSISAVTEKTFVLTDEFELDADTAAAAEIISQYADVSVQEVRFVGTKLILKGDVRSSLIYLTDDRAIESATFHTTFSQIIETELDTEEAVADVSVLTSGMYYEVLSVSDGRSITMELHLVVQAVVCTRCRVRYLADAYSNAFALTTERLEQETLLFGREVILRESTTAQIETPGEIGSVIACQAAPIGWSCDEGEITVQLTAHLCWCSGDCVCSTERTLTVRFRPETGDELLKICGAAVQDIRAVPAGSAAELRISMEIRAFTVVRSTVDCIRKIEYDQESPLDLDGMPTLVILYPQSPCDLWSLAKENHSTVEAICRANALEDDASEAGGILLIPKVI